MRRRDIRRMGEVPQRLQRFVPAGWPVAVEELTEGAGGGLVVGGVFIGVQDPALRGWLDAWTRWLIEEGFAPVEVLSIRRAARLYVTSEGRVPMPDPAVESTWAPTAHPEVFPGSEARDWWSPAAPVAPER